MSDNHDQQVPPDTLVLKLTREPWKLDIGGTLTEIELIINVLQQAQRFFEDQRFFAAVAEQERLQQQRAKLASLGDLGLGRRQ